MTQLPPKQDRIEKCGNQVIHIRGDSDTKLDDLFKVLETHKPPPGGLSLKDRKLPASFHKQPDPKPSPLIAHSRAKSAPEVLFIQSPQLTNPLKHESLDNLVSNDYIAHSGATNNAGLYIKDQVYSSQQLPGVDLGPMPPGWEQSLDSSGHVYFINHFDKTTTWDDPRLTEQVRQRLKFQTFTAEQQQQQQALEQKQKQLLLQQKHHSMHVAALANQRNYIKNQPPLGHQSHQQQHPEQQQIKPMSPCVDGYKPMSPCVDSFKPMSPHVDSFKPMSPHVDGFRLMSPRVESFKPMSPRVDAFKPMSPRVDAFKQQSIANKEQVICSELEKLKLEKERLNKEKLRIEQQEQLWNNLLFQSTNSKGNMKMDGFPAGGVMKAGHQGSALGVEIGTPVQDSHIRQNSGDSGFGGMNSTYTLPPTPDQYLNNTVEDMDVRQDLAASQLAMQNPSMMCFGMNDNSSCISPLGISDMVDTGMMDINSIGTSMNDESDGLMLNDSDLQKLNSVLWL